MSEIQSEPETMPCFHCGGKGSFLIVERDREEGEVGKPWRYVYENTYVHSQLKGVRYVDHYICGECGGKGVVEAPRLKQ